MSQNHYNDREPVIRVVKRAELPDRQITLLRLLALILALAAGGLFILCVGYNPFVIYGTILSGALRSPMAIQATVKIIIPLLIPLALRGVTYKPIGASALLRRNLFIYGLGGITAPFLGIKLIDILISVFF